MDKKIFLAYSTCALLYDVVICSALLLICLYITDNKKTVALDSNQLNDIALWWSLIEAVIKHQLRKLANTPDYLFHLRIMKHFLKKKKEN